MTKATSHMATPVPVSRTSANSIISSSQATSVTKTPPASSLGPGKVERWPRWWTGTRIVHAAAVLRNAPATLDLGPVIRSGRARRRPDSLPVAGAKLKLIPLPSPHALGSVAAQPRVLTHYKNQHRHSPCACRQRRPILPERLDADRPPGRSERQRRLQIRATWPWACAGRTSSRDRSRPGDPPRHQRRNTLGPWPVYPPRRPAAAWLLPPSLGVSWAPPVAAGLLAAPVCAPKGRRDSCLSGFVPGWLAPVSRPLPP